MSGGLEKSNSIHYVYNRKI